MNLKEWIENNKGSGGRMFVNKAEGLEIFIDYCGGARLREIGSSYWISTTECKKGESFEDIVKRLTIKPTKPL